MSNQLLPFLLPQRGVRGFAVEISEGIPELLGWRNYPPDVVSLLGEVLAATPLLAADMREAGRFNIQFQGKGALKLLVTQVDHELRLRGMAKCDEKAAGDFQQLMGGGMLACLLESRRERSHDYQAVVEVLGESLAESLQIYFHQSVQMPSLVRLAASPGKLAGLMLQRLPEGAGQQSENWLHVNHLFSTLKPAELLADEAQRLLQKLFAEDEVRVFEPRPITLACQCSHAGISAMLLGLGEDELKPVLEEKGRVEVTCEFCGRTYSYPDIEVRELFAAASTAPGQQTLLN